MARIKSSLAALLIAPAIACGGTGTDTDSETNLVTTLPLTTTTVTDSESSETGETSESEGTDATSPSGSDSNSDSDSETTEGPTDSDSDPTDSDTDTDTDSDTDPPCDPASCPEGQFCGDSNMCEPGCDEDSDCSGMSTCDLDSNQCVGCAGDQDCALGTVCLDGACEPGCNDQQPCQMGFTCCTGMCVDPLNDIEHCGGCDSPCEDLANAEDVCVEGMCGLGMCEDGFDNCNGNIADGCETDGACACEPGEQQSCYTGLPNTENVGECQSGTQTCDDDGTSFGPCMGEILPDLELCANNKDDNCDGVVDEDPDLDNDGYSVCGGDCCDQVGEACQNPELVNPGAFEVGGNMVDDDCDGGTDNPLPLCDNAIASNTGDPLQYARAIDLCQFTTENAQGEDRVWGVISGSFSLANGNGNPNANSRSVRNGFGANANQLGNRMAVISSGHAADSNDNSPNFAPYQNGQQLGTQSGFPTDWYMANGNQLPNAPGCPGITGNAAFDPVQLRLRIRVPTNANSFSTKMFFFSAEYPEYVCTAFNDFFVTLVDSNDNDNPDDKNIAIYSQGNNTYPVGVNILKAANGLFTQCSNGQITQCGNAANYNGCQGTNLLNGTGFDIVGATNFSCGYGGRHGGGTGWLTMSGNVIPGETMEIRFTIWDTSDGLFDSTVLLDAWEWSVQASEPGVTPG